MTNRSKAADRQASIKPAIKRKVGYDMTEYEVLQARKQMVNMNMNDR